MEIHTIPTKAYCVTSTGSCEITANLPSGEAYTLASIGPSGGQSVFIAVSSSITVSDPKALVTPVHRYLQQSQKNSATSSQETSYISLSADGKILTVRQPDSFAVTPFYTGDAAGGNLRSWAYNISPNITHIDGGGVLIAPQDSNRLLAFMTYLKSVIGVDYSQVIDADYMFALSGMESFDVCFPRATTAFGLFNSCQKLHTVRLIIPLTADLRECFYATSAPRHVTLHAGKCTVLNFAEGFAKGDIGAIRNVENLEFEDYDGTSALASCTTFKLYAYHTKLTNQAISNCVGALPDWSLTGKSATCQFPAGRLTEEQKGILTAKGWTYTEV